MKLKFNLIIPLILIIGGIILLKIGIFSLSPIPTPTNNHQIQLDCIGSSKSVCQINDFFIEYNFNSSYITNLGGNSNISEMIISFSMDEPHDTAQIDINWGDDNLYLIKKTLKEGNNYDLIEDIDYKSSEGRYWIQLTGLKGFKKTEIILYFKGSIEPSGQFGLQFSNVKDNKINIHVNRDSPPGKTRYSIFIFNLKGYTCGSPCLFLTFPVEKSINHAITYTNERVQQLLVYTTEKELANTTFVPFTLNTTDSIEQNISEIMVALGIAILVPGIYLFLENLINPKNANDKMNEDNKNEIKIESIEILKILQNNYPDSIKTKDLLEKVKLHGEVKRKVTNYIENRGFGKIDDRDDGKSYISTKGLDFIDKEDDKDISKNLISANSILALMVALTAILQIFLTIGILSASNSIIRNFILFLVTVVGILIVIVIARVAGSIKRNIQRDFQKRLTK